MLATLTVNANTDGAISNNDGNLTLREAIAYVNGTATPDTGDLTRVSGTLGENDAIVFAPGLNGQTITITGTNLVVSKRVTITGPTGIGNRIAIEKGGSSTATIGLRFQSFNLAPNNVLPADTGVFNLGFSGFDTGVEVASLSSTNYNFELPLRIVGNEITDNFTGIHIDNSDVPFKIEGNRIVGTSPTAGIGIRLTNSEQTVVNLPATYEPAIAGNVIGSFARGVFVQNVDFPDLRITGNRIGVDDDLHGQNELPNGLGIDVALGTTTSVVGRIDHNDIVYNQTDGIRIHETDRIVIEDNLIGANGGDGIDLNRASGDHTIRNNTFDSNGDNGVDGDGVTIHPLTSGTEASQIVISENDFLGMKPWALPIDLGDDGQDPIDVNDFDPGVNHRQNHPELTSISFDGSSWILGIKLDVGGSVMGETVRFEFYRYNSDLKNYEWIRSITDEVPEQEDYENSFYFSDGTELSVGDGIAMIAVVTSGPFINDTSEMSPQITLALPGDFNRDGRVDAADYTIWRDTKGSSVPKFSGADGSGNGIIDVADYALWKSNFGLGTPGGASTFAVPGDYNLDGIVDELDFDLWESTFGSTTNLAADGNFNGVIDLADLEVWQAFRGVTTLDTLVGDFNSDFVVDTADYDLWMSGSGSADADGDGIVLGDMDDFAIWEANFGTVRADVFPDVKHGSDGKPLEIPDFAPIVLNVSIGSQSFAALAGSGEQLRSVTAASPNSVSIRFSEEVFVTVDALQVINLDGTSPANVTSFVYDLATQTVTWTFDAPLADGRTLLRLSDSVFDLDHEALDGEFFNPTMLSDSGSAVFPSGDGDEGGEFRFRFTVLSGDSDHDNVDGTTDYTNWQSSEPGMIIVSTTADDYDSDLTFGDVSLREAVDYANTAGTATAIQLPAGRYTLSRTGTESTTANVAVNDLDVTGDVTIVGAGPGLSIIDNSGLVSAHARTFEIDGAARRLKLSRLTVANGSYSLPNAAVVNGGATLDISDSAVVNHTAFAGAAAVQVSSSTLVVSRSVFTNNDNTSFYGGTAISVYGISVAPSSISVGESIFALNTQPLSGGGTSNYAIGVYGIVTKENRGRNLYDYAGGGFFDTTPGADDHLGTVDYVVTSVADTFDHGDDNEALSIREAVDLANQVAGTQEIWIPAWNFTLSRDRGTNATDTDVSYGDIDVKDSVVIRGVAGRTSIAWKPGIVDKVFDLLGDYNEDGLVDASDDWVMWDDQFGLSGAWEQYSADGDDDGDVDWNDNTVWTQNLGHSLQLFDVAL